MSSEITPPRSEVCPSNIQVTTSTAITEIQKPKVVFRTGDGTEAPHICDLFGDKPSYNFTIGLHTITCRAFDPVFGDQAVTVCKFTIKIKRKYNSVLHNDLHNNYITRVVVLLLHAMIKFFWEPHLVTIDLYYGSVS